MKNYNKTKPMRIEEFDAEKAWWNDRVENEHAWKVSADDIKARNYNLDIKNPHSPDAEVHDPDNCWPTTPPCNSASARPATSSRPCWPPLWKGRRERGAERTPAAAGSAPDGIQKLRGLILELAVRGKLVPQDPNDEPASELLKRIAKERARLEAEGKIKKSKPAYR